MKILLVISTVFVTLIGARSCEPTPEQLAFHWAPIHYQDIHQREAHGRKDFITSVDRKGRWDLSANWKNFGDYPLEAWVYYSVVSSRSHHFITYAFYHPLDWDSGEDKNDFEGALFVIKRDDTEWGRLEAVLTVWHDRFHTCYPSDTPLTAGCSSVEQDEYLIQWENGRVMTSQEWGGHGFGCYPAYIKKNNDAVIYTPSPKTAAVPPRIPHRIQTRVPYRLVDIFTGDGLWDNRYNDRVFDPGRKWAVMIGGHGNPPWAWDAEDDGGLCLRGIWTHDPALLAQYYFKLKDSTVRSWEYFSRDYTRNPYRDDMDILSHANAKELYSNQYMSLDYWINNHGGECSNYGRRGND